MSILESGLELGLNTFLLQTCSPLVFQIRIWAVSKHLSLVSAKCLEGPCVLCVQSPQPSEHNHLSSQSVSFVAAPQQRDGMEKGEK